jgi:hypothetical protein
MRREKVYVDSSDGPRKQTKNSYLDFLMNRKKIEETVQTVLSMYCIFASGG